MKFTQDTDGTGYTITAYNKSGIAVNGRHFEHSLMLSASTLVENWGPETISGLDADHIKQLYQLKPELVILGTGNKLVFPAIEIYASLIQQNIGIEFMDTRAACRTYNIVVGEGRNVVAGIIIESPGISFP